MFFTFIYNWFPEVWQHSNGWWHASYNSYLMCADHANTTLFPAKNSHPAGDGPLAAHGKQVKSGNRLQAAGYCT